MRPPSTMSNDVTFTNMYVPDSSGGRGREGGRAHLGKPEEESHEHHTFGAGGTTGHVRARRTQFSDLAPAAARQQSCELLIHKRPPAIVVLREGRGNIFPRLLGARLAWKSNNTTTNRTTPTVERHGSQLRIASCVFRRLLRAASSTWCRREGRCRAWSSGSG